MAATAAAVAVDLTSATAAQDNFVSVGEFMPFTRKLQFYPAGCISGNAIVIKMAIEVFDLGIVLPDDVEKKARMKMALYTDFKCLPSRPLVATEVVECHGGRNEVPVIGSTTRGGTIIQPGVYWLVTVFDKPVTMLYEHGPSPWIWSYGDFDVPFNQRNQIRQRHPTRTGAGTGTSFNLYVKGRRSRTAAGMLVPPDFPKFEELTCKFCDLKAWNYKMVAHVEDHISQAGRSPAIEANEYRILLDDYKDCFREGNGALVWMSQLQGDFRQPCDISIPVKYCNPNPRFQEALELVGLKHSTPILWHYDPKLVDMKNLLSALRGLVRTYTAGVSTTAAPRQSTKVESMKP